MAIVYETAGKEDLALGVGTGVRTAPGGGQMPINLINLATFALSTSQVYDPGQVSPGVAVALDVTVPGAQLGDVALVTFTGSMDHTLGFEARVSAADTVRVVIHNHGVIAFNPGSGTLRVLVFRIP